MGDSTPVSMAFFLAALEALEREGEPKLVTGPEAGWHPNLDAIREHLGKAEALFRGLPRGPGRSGGERAVDLEYLAGIVKHLKFEAHDFGSEAFPPHFWDSCEEIEGYLRAAAAKSRAEEGA
jgi:hypothetical protein